MSIHISCGTRLVLSKPKFVIQPNNLDDDSDGFLVVVKEKWDLKPASKRSR